MPRPLRVAVVEDQSLYRAMLGSLVNSHPELSLVSLHPGYVDAVDRIDQLAVDVAVVDIDLGDGNGFLLGRKLRRTNPKLGIVLLSSQDQLPLVLNLPSHERQGWSYLSKTSALSPALIVDVVKQTSRGSVVIDPELLARSTARAGSAVADLTPRQFHVLQLAAQGRSSRAIAAELMLSYRSVEGHLEAIYATLGIAKNDDVNNRVAAVIQFIDQTSRSE